MKFVATSIADVIIVEPDIFSDHRGFFMETWQRNKYIAGGISSDFVQDNHSKSSQATLRGLHYQLRNPQGKLIRVISGEIYDVAVDIRQSSPTFGQWTGEYLDNNNMRMLWIPPGFAHGYYVLSETAEVCYKCTEYYSPEYERTLRWNDPMLAIRWPLINDQQPILSEKDKHGNLLKEAEVFV